MGGEREVMKAFLCVLAECVCGCVCVCGGGVFVCVCLARVPCASARFGEQFAFSVMLKGQTGVRGFQNLYIHTSCFLSSPNQAVCARTYVRVCMYVCVCVCVFVCCGGGVVVCVLGGVC